MGSGEKTTETEHMVNFVVEKKDESPNTILRTRNALAEEVLQLRSDNKFQQELLLMEKEKAALMKENANLRAESAAKQQDEHRRETVSLVCRNALEQLEAKLGKPPSDERIPFWVRLLESKSHVAQDLMTTILEKAFGTHVPTITIGGNARQQYYTTQQSTTVARAMSALYTSLSEKVHSMATSQIVLSENDFNQTQRVMLRAILEQSREAHLIVDAAADFVAAAAPIPSPFAYVQGFPAWVAAVNTEGYRYYFHPGSGFYQYEHPSQTNYTGHVTGL